MERGRAAGQAGRADGSYYLDWVGFSRLQRSQDCSIPSDRRGLSADVSISFVVASSHFDRPLVSSGVLNVAKRYM